MNKQIALSIEQMKHLESLGLDTSDASMCYKLNPWRSDGTLCMGSVPKINDIDNPLYVPAYTLSNLLSKLQGIEHETTDSSGNYHLYAPRFWGDGFNQMAWVDLTNPSSSPMMTTGNIDSLTSAYQMLLWCIEEGYYKQNNNESD